MTSIRETAITASILFITTLLAVKILMMCLGTLRAIIRWLRPVRWASKRSLATAWAAENTDYPIWEAEALAEDGVISSETHQDLAAVAARKGSVKRASTFYRHWVAEVRMKFPLRTRKPSDQAAMKKWLADEMRLKGIRITHIADAVPRVVALATNRSRAEVEAIEMADQSAPWDTTPPGDY